MSRLLATIVKNFKVLFRNKIAAVTVLFAPLLIVLLVGFAYTTGGQTSLLIGINGDQDSRYIDALENNSRFDLVNATSAEACQEDVKRGVVDACVNISSGNVTVLDVYVDQSRTDLAREVETAARRSVGVESEKQREEIVSERYASIKHALSELENRIEDLESLESSVNSVIKDLNTVSDVNTVSAQDAPSFEDIQSDVDEIDDTGASLESSLDDLVTAADTYLDATSNNSGDDEYDSLSNQSNRSSDTLTSSNLSSKISSISSALDDVESTFEATQDTVKTANSRIQSAQDTSSSAVSKLNSVKSNVSALSDDLKVLQSGLESLSDQDIDYVADPVETSVKAVGGTDSFSFGKSTPYLVAIETFFFALLLGGALAFNQNVGKPSFREHLTPLHSVTRVVTVLITGFIISVVQTVLTAGGALAHLGLWENIDVAAVSSLLLTGSIIALLLGIILGQLFRTMEGLLLGALTTGSLFIAFSNFIAPLERLHPLAQEAGIYNPFNILGESLRQAFFFGKGLDAFSNEFIILGVFAAIGVFFAVIGQYRWERDTTTQQNGTIVKHRIRLKNAASQESLVSFIDTLSWTEYMFLRSYIDEAVQDWFDGPDQPPVFKRKQWLDELQSSSSMSSMSSNESKSSSSSSDDSSAPSDSSSEDSDEDVGDSSEDDES